MKSIIALFVILGFVSTAYGDDHKIAVPTPAESAHEAHADHPSHATEKPVKKKIKKEKTKKHNDDHKSHAEDPHKQEAKQ